MNLVKTKLRIFVLLFVFLVARPVTAVTLQLWHQMMYAHRQTLDERIKVFEQQNPDIRVRTVYRETEELRSAFQTAALGGGGPELIYGPSDMIGPLATMGTLHTIDDFFSPSEWSDFDPVAIPSFQGRHYGVGDSVGNFLMVIYNKQLVRESPRTLKDFLELAKQNTKDLNGDGLIDRWGLVFNATEPFFLVPWIYGFGGSILSYDPQGQLLPQLDSEAVEKALEWVRDLRFQYKVLPPECDYETANSLFKTGAAAMIINGDWSWADYLQADISFGVSTFPFVEDTKQFPRTFVGSKVFAVNAQVKDPNTQEAVRRLLQFLLSPESQYEFASRNKTIPSRLSVRKRWMSEKAPSWLAPAMEVLQHQGETMPVDPRLRAIWDALRKNYQAVLSGAVSSSVAAKNAQQEAWNQIQTMEQVKSVDPSLHIVQWLIFVVVFYTLVRIIRRRSQWWVELRQQKAGWLMILPGLLILTATLFYPFVYNLLLSLSNLSLSTFKNWELVGLHNYLQVLSDESFYFLLIKTVVWAGSNVLAHLVLGVTLAILIDRWLPAKHLWRTLLMISWAIPQYIAALTARSMFHQQYGVVNYWLSFFIHSTQISWLNHPQLSLLAAWLTNLWLGFPFMMMVAWGGLKSIPQSLYESAMLDGASSWQQIRRITLPLLWPVMRPALILGFFWTFNNFNVVWLVSNGGEPADSSHILITYAYKSAFNLYRYSYAAAFSVILFLILFSLNKLIQGKLNKLASWEIK